jgi:NADPH:quinone reductase-like Zn-dependent oxidoreductase
VWSGKPAGSCRDDECLISSAHSHVLVVLSRFVSLAVEPNVRQLGILGSMLDEGRLRVKVAKTFPLEQAARALEEQRAGGHVGKLVIVM